MKPIQENERYTLSRIVTDNLRNYIVENKLTTGDKLPSERDLASDMAVSRVIIREALRALESTGIIEIRHGEGAFVNTDDPSAIFKSLLFFWQINNAKVEELFELRHILEKTAIEQMIENSNEGHLLSLEQNIKNMSTTNDPDKFKEYDIQFHMGIINATKNELFSQLIDVIGQYFANVSPLQLTDFEKELTIREHKLIVEAMKNKDKKLALQLLDTHLQRSMTYRTEQRI
ncbi:FadR/GntR family transcriptional regulator [Pseudogracilibacillus auburnensis]|uniref:FadR/GntR family transcriptional regulator n=1 Tax=Pseudogracilibacillus auburnensis TaxID=1494959 RepID=UPI001A96EBE9|nr:FadR/GntR family transcriptional regulator [Pseudogracilibacillus auburnensis]MBO1004825.1 FadR family transcriptional regulator [Pseudogracilibacillus auburnensis]